MAQTGPANEPILTRVARGDADAVQDCLDRYGALVWSLTRRALRDPGQAEDVVQEIFIAVWKSASRFDPRIASEATFITTIARRRLIDSQRRSARRRETDTIEEESLVAESDAGLEQVEIADEAARAAEAIGRLKPVERRVLTLSIMKGMTHAEIASYTTLPLGTVKSHLRRGLERAKQMVEGDGQPIKVEGTS